MRTPYVGITDFMHADQVRRMLEVFIRCHGAILHRHLMVGVMMSYKTLHGLPTKWAKAFPPKEGVYDIFDFHPLVFNVLHYADDDGIDVAASIAEATCWGGQAISGLQLDMVWPDPGIIKSYREKFPRVQVIIQGNTKAMEAVGNDPRAFADRLREYGDAIDYVLLDKSMGRGIGMDAQALIPFARAVKDLLPDLGLVGAGGLGPGTCHLAEPLIKEFPDVSIDAQGKLRPSGSALDPVEWTMAAQYLKESLGLCEKYRRTL